MHVFREKNSLRVGVVILTLLISVIFSGCGGGSNSTDLTKATLVLSLVNVGATISGGSKIYHFITGSEPNGTTLNIEAGYIVGGSYVTTLKLTPGDWSFKIIAKDPGGKEIGGCTTQSPTTLKAGQTYNISLKINYGPPVNYNLNPS